MKTLITICSIMMLVLSAAGFGGYQYNPGVYPTTSGTWTETYDGGGPGQLGNIFTAQSTGWSYPPVPANQWKIYGTLDVAPTIIATGSEGGVAYTTYLTGYTGEILLGGGGWGGSTQFNPAPFTITAQSFEDGTLISTLYFQRVNPAIPALGWEESTIILTGVGERTGFLSMDAGHYGTVDTAIVTVIPEPATLALLGLGGLFLRKRK